MWFRSAFSFLKLDSRGRTQRLRRRRSASRLLLEVLEDRTLPSFLTPVAYAAGGEPQAVATADFRNNGIQDLVTIDANVNVLLGNGDGTFQEARTFATAPFPRDLAVGDFNGDGKLDIVTASPDDTSYSGTLSLLLGNGDGTFQAPTNFTLPGVYPPGYKGPSPQRPDALAAGDMNHDGRDDLVVLGESAGPTFYVNVLLGQANGTFAPASVSEFPTAPHSVALGDFNGDGNLDAAMLSGRGVSIMLGNGAGSLAAPVTTPAPAGSSLAVGDVNGDGKLDLATTDYPGSDVSVLLGNGDGTFAAPTTIPLPPTQSGPQSATAVVMGDLDGDGKMDLAVSAESSYEVYAGSGPYGRYFYPMTAINANILLGHGDGTFTVAETDPVIVDNGAEGRSGIAAATFNGDAFPDLVVPDVLSETVSVLLNGANWSTNPGPSSFAVSGFPSTTTAGASGSFTVTALNADGSIDTGYTGTVHFTSSDGQAALPGDYMFTTADAGAHTFSAVLQTAGTQSLTASDGGITGSASGIMVTPAAASKMIVSGFPSPTTAGLAGSFTVTLEDPYGNVAAGYTGTVQFTSSDPKAVLPTTYAFTASDAGRHSFSATLKTAGTQSISVTDTAGASLTGTDGGITVNPAAASKFLISAPTSVQVGASFSLTVTVEDAYGNVVTNYLGTVHFSSSDTRAKLPANYTFTAADKGMRTFSGLVLRKTGYQRITVTDTHNSALTASVIITPATH